MGRVSPHGLQTFRWNPCSPMAESCERVGLPGALLCMATYVMDAFEVTTTTVTNGYAALREDAAWLDLSGRGKIRATGEDRARLLHAMTTNQVETLKPGEGC